MESVMKKVWYAVALLVVAYPFLAVGYKLILEENIVTWGTYFLILVGLVLGIWLGLRQKPTPAQPTKPAWEKALNERQ
jgi:hypothetical protein